MPDPILVSIAAALAGKGATGLYDLVKKKLAGSLQATKALDAAEGSPPDSPEVHALSAELARAESSDPQFAADLRAIWSHVSARQHAEKGGVVNGITGTVGGNVLQARDIGGGVSF
ncbi:MAG: hypothetical protein ACRDSZ_15925 [Pseudonocardiaceae bacterium]